MVEFWSFPAEIRRHIYERYFQQLSAKVYYCGPDVYAKGSDKRTEPYLTGNDPQGRRVRTVFKLLFVSRQVRHESVPLLFKNVTFDFHELKHDFNKDIFTNVSIPPAFARNIQHLRVSRRSQLGPAYLNRELIERYSFAPSTVKIVVTDPDSQMDISDESFGPLLRGLIHGKPPCHICFNLDVSMRSRQDGGVANRESLADRQWLSMKVDEEQAISILKRAKNRQNHELNRLFKDYLGLRMERLTMTKDMIVLEVSKGRRVV